MCVKALEKVKAWRRYLMKWHINMLETKFSGHIVHVESVKGFGEHHTGTQATMSQAALLMDVITVSW